jgi:hypothetical protein
VNRRGPGKRAVNRRGPGKRAVNRRGPGKRTAAVAATVIGIAAALVAGYAAAGATGLIDVASVATLGVLIVARGTVRGQKPRTVQDKDHRRDPGRRSAIRAADFPAYVTIASDVEWAQMSRRHYNHALRPRLARLAAVLGRSPFDSDGPGIDLATLDRIITQLEGP